MKTIEYPIKLIKKADCDLEIARIEAEKKLEPLIKQNKLSKTPKSVKRMIDIALGIENHYETKG